MSIALLASPSCWLALFRNSFACLLEVNDVDVVDVTYFIDGDPPTPVDGEGEVKDANGNPLLQNVGKGEVEDVEAIPCSKLVEKAMSITAKLMAKPLAGCFDKGIANDVKVGVEAQRLSEICNSWRDCFDGILWCLILFCFMGQNERETLERIKMPKRGGELG